jgi:hypothetical protein
MPDPAVGSANPVRDRLYWEAMAVRNVLVRIAIWASAGFLVSLGWGLYFATRNKEIPIEATAYALAKLTQPIVAAYLYLKPQPLSLAWVAITNAAIYALLGLVVETIRRYYRPVHTST